MVENCRLVLNGQVLLNVANVNEVDVLHAFPNHAFNSRQGVGRRRPPVSNGISELLINNFVFDLVGDLVDQAAGPLEITKPESVDGLSCGSGC